jgi:hypothetical protein
MAWALRQDSLSSLLPIERDSTDVSILGRIEVDPVLAVPTAAHCKVRKATNGCAEIFHSGANLVSGSQPGEESIGGFGEYG